MFDHEFKIPLDTKATLISIVCPRFKGHESAHESERSMEELKELMRTLGIGVTGTHIQNRKQLDSATMIGAGKLEEIANEAKEAGSKLLVFDYELSASQMKNIKKVTGLDIADRVNIILEIFASHARTKEAKIQIEIARLEYLLPRLPGLWSHLGRQRAVRGVVGGEGEQQIELDRRIIKERIEYFKKELKGVIRSRIEQKKRRQGEAITAAIVGYTNAGKSSLMNRLCKVDVLEEDMLFATLDSTYRTLNPDTKPPMILIDTVGFISNLPSTLINGFRTTLESAIEADLLIIVCDLSDPHFEKHLEVTSEVLLELGVTEKDRLIVFNKKDKLKDPFKAKLALRTHPGSFLISTYDEHDISRLRDYIIDYFLKKQEPYDLFVPYEDGAAHSIVVSKTNIIATVNHEKGIYYRIRVPAFIYDGLNLKGYILAPEESLKIF